MSADHEVHATGYELNMAGWCSEKSRGVVEGVARALELLKQIEGTEEAQRQLHLTLNYATKLFAFGTGGKWNLEHPALVIERGMTGVDQVARAYGLPVPERHWYEPEELYAAIEELLAGPASPNRTLLHELLRTQRSRPHVLERLTRFTELLERVTQGELAWSEFVDAGKREVAAARRAEAERS